MSKVPYSIEKKIEVCLIFAMLAQGRLSTCPRCHTLCERLDKKNRRVTCPDCSRKLDRDYDFCFYCEKEWTVSGTEKCSDGCHDPLVDTLQAGGTKVNFKSHQSPQ